MPLSANDIAALSRLLDQALELRLEDREAWLAELPVELRHLEPSLRRMLLTSPDRDDELLQLTLPQLPDLGPSGDSAPRPGELVGPYRLCSVIGHGGMGTVWLAERADGIFERQVALKLPDVERGPHLAERMARERQIGARLEHPNIARLYDAGIDDTGRPYLVMEWVQGHNLVEHCSRHGLPRADRLRLLLQACAALAHAHALLVVHRDIKPSNILVDLTGQVKLLDFGISRWLPAPGQEASGGSEDSRHTHTPGFAAPEQRLGQALSTAADIYALGVVAHLLLLWRMPGAAATPGDPLAEAPGPDLQAVLDKALQADPAQRYSSVERLADDLRCVLEQRPVSAVPAPWSRRTVLFVRRHRGPVAAAAAAVVVGVSGLALLLHQQAREAAQAVQTAQAREFLFDLLEHVEPGDTPGAGPITAVQLIEGAVQRAQGSFPGQPAMHGAVLSQLGLLLRNLGQGKRALEVLAEANRLLESTATADDPALHIARAQLAIQLLQTARPDAARARTLSEAVLSGCTADSARCAKARAYAHAAMRIVMRLGGDVPAAIRHAERAVLETDRAFGSHHAEAAMARLHFAQVQRNAGRYVDAAASLDQALALAADLVLRASDRRQLELWDAIVAADLGRHDKALARVDLLIQAPGADLALLGRFRAQSLQAQGRWTAALEAADAALVKARDARDEWDEAFVRQSRARSLSSLGRHESARVEIEAVLASLGRQGLAPNTLEQLRARRFAAEFALRAGDLEAARTMLAGLCERHRPDPSAAPLAPIDLAACLDLQGAVERRTERYSAASALHAEARVLLAAVLPDEHPLRRRNALDAALTSALAAAPTADLAGAVQRYLDVLPPDSAWRPVLRALPTDPSAGKSLVL